MRGPKVQAEKVRDDLRKSTFTFDKDKMALANAKGCFKDYKKSLEEIQTNKKKLDLDYQKVLKEKNDMYERFEVVVG